MLRAQSCLQRLTCKCIIIISIIMFNVYTIILFNDLCVDDENIYNDASIDNKASMFLLMNDELMIAI